MVGGELQEALQQVAAGGDAGVQDHLPAHRRQPAKICCRLYQQA